MKNDTLEIYVEYMISSFNATTATDLSSVLDGDVSHDAITRMLASSPQTNKDLWLRIKSLVREIEGEDGVLIIDKASLLCYSISCSAIRDAFLI